MISTNQYKNLTPIMRYICFLLIISFTSCKWERKNESVLEKCNRELRSVSLSFKHSLTSENLIVTIQNYHRDNITVYYKYIPEGASNPYDYEFKNYTLDSTMFDGIAEGILKIDRQNIEKESKTIGFDGVSTSISFYEKDINTVNNVYPIWAPQNDTEKRRLHDYLDVYNELIKLAFIEPDSLF